MHAAYGCEVFLVRLVIQSRWSIRLWCAHVCALHSGCRNKIKMESLEIKGPVFCPHDLYEQFMFIPGCCHQVECMGCCPPVILLMQDAIVQVKYVGCRPPVSMLTLPYCSSGEMCGMQPTYNYVDTTVDETVVQTVRFMGCSRSAVMLTQRYYS